MAYQDLAAEKSSGGSSAGDAEARRERTARRGGRACVVALVVWVVGLALARPAHADERYFNVLAGPVLGFHFGGGQPRGGLFGIEGGVGFGPERLNLGLTSRAGEGFAYIELDPWYVVGASIGVGIGTQSGTQPVLGLWEGLPLWPQDQDCNDGGAVVTLSVGYRYTGVHEVYLAPKVGFIDQYGPCIH